MRTLLALLCAAATIACCKPTPTTLAGPAAAGDGGPTPASFADEGTAVCAHLSAIGCAMPATCVQVFHDDQGKLTDFKPACLLAAATPAAANACGTLRCPVTP